MKNGKFESPTPAQILAARREAGLTQAQAAERVLATSYRTWQDWERGQRSMPASVWELWRLQDILAANPVFDQPAQP